MIQFDNKIKVLFLDIDGVLNRFDPYSDIKLESELINNLKHIINETGCKIVISSTWKASKELVQFLEVNLLSLLPDGCFLGYTPTLIPQVARENEIKLWLNEHSKIIDKWIVVDDYDFELTSIIDHCVITNALNGLTKEKNKRMHKET